MDYIYELMDRAKQTKAKSFLGKEENYYCVFYIIYNKWGNQFHCHLQVGGHYLILKFYYSNRTKSKADKEIV